MTSPGVGTGRRRSLGWVAAVAGFLLVAVALGAPPPEDRGLYDPDGTGPNGARALVLLLESFGAEVEVTDELPADRDAVVFLFTDVVGPDGVPALEAWVRRGGTLVTADPTLPLAAAPADAGGGEIGFGVGSLRPGDCDVPVLADLGQIEPPEAFWLDVPTGAAGCFTGGADDAFVVVAPLGDGEVVTLGGARLFLNDWLGAADNAALAQRLLAPAPGGRVTLLQPGPGFDSGRSLTDAVPVGTRWALLQLLVAFGVYAWFRARRLGAPVPETQPVQIAGSELVLAVGNLYQLRRDPAAAADLLRRDMCRQLGLRLGLAADAAPEVVADVAAARSGLDQARLRRALADGPVLDDHALVALAAELDEIRTEVLHGR